MSEYWKSVPRKFCEFCKCWITDNKPSVDFHERGKRHQENVKKKIEEVKKKSLEKAKKDEEMDSDMKKMEKAALEAFRQDLADNPEMAAGYAAQIKATRDAELSKEKKSKSSKRRPDEEKTLEVSETQHHDIQEWYEAKSPEGYTYYWSTVTGASIWEAPDKYVSLAEQEKKAEEALGKNSLELKSNESKKQKELVNCGVESTTRKEFSDRQDRSTTNNRPEKSKKQKEILEKLDKLKKEKLLLSADVNITPDMIPLPGEVTSTSEIPLPSESIPSENIPLPDDRVKPERDVPREDPRWARSSYGYWETVRDEEPVYLDLELPEPAPGTDISEIPLPEIVPSEPQMRFKEKKVISLGNHDNTPVVFKKRKFGHARSMRKRDGDV